MIEPRIPKPVTHIQNPSDARLLEATWYRWMREFLRVAQREWDIQSSQAADFTAKRDSWYPVDTSGGDVTVTLPDPNNLLPGARVGIKHMTTGGTCTVQQNGTDTIDGLASVIVVNLEFVIFLFLGNGEWARS